ncbi:MAG: glycosyltransferase [Flammeovirgaceae bacterium]
MKVLLIIDSLGSGGAQKQIINLAKGLKQRGHNVELFYYNSYSNFFLDELSGLKIKSHSYKQKKYYLPFLKHFFIIYALRKIIKKDFDGIISFMQIPSIYSCFAKIGLNSKLIVCERNSSLASIPLFIRVLFYFSCLISDSVVANSQSEALLLKKRFFNLKKVYSVWNGYDIQKMSTKKISESNSFQKKLLVVGRITFQKNGYNLLKSLKLFHEINGWLPEIKWAGRLDSNDKKSKIMKKKMDILLSENPILNSKFKFIGEVSNIYELYKTSDALIHVSRYEGFANAICESMIYGCLVICSRVCDNETIIGYNRGLMCNHLEPESIYNTIDLMYKMDKKKIIKITRDARNFAIDNFSLKRMTHMYEKILIN